MTIARKLSVLCPAALLLGVGLVGCGGGGGEGGNPDAAAVIGTDANDPNFGAASADMMSNMHGDSLDTNKKKAAEKEQPK